MKRPPTSRGGSTYALDRMVAELERPGMLLGIHPEGTRNKSPDPYTLLRAQPGVGTILARSAHTRVVPVFVTGLSNGFGSEFSRTWGRRRREFPIDVVFGAPIEFDDLSEQGNRLAVHMKMTQRCMSAVEALGHHHRDEIAQTVGR